MTIATGDERSLLSDAGFLAEAGQGIELAENGNHRTTVAGFAHDGCGKARHIALNAETFLDQQARMLLTGVEFLIVCFRRIPDEIAERKESLAFRFDEIPDGIGVFHGVGDSLVL